ncbi:MAG: phospho-N-acetylmuramoyl-pentapeptide-transferase [Candidatus Acetothermia bacterium]|nr:phospho-N-acetylmuramoyl-pentapeptide-transferase [Candidatus Acetothermia bacterium]
MNYLELGLLAFLLSLVGSWAFLRVARRLRLGKHIREYGPEIHAKKEGTPTMGGLVVLLVFAATLLVAWSWEGIPSPRLLLLLGATLGYGGIGLLDDLLALARRRSLGLLIRYKLLLQLALAGTLFWALRLAGIPAEAKVPFAQLWLEMPLWLHGLLAILVLVCTTNAMNLTDGLDGLATGVTVIVLLPFLWVLRGEPALDLWGAIVIFSGALGGFLWFNCYPARVFLGDTGSLALGGFLGMLALLSGASLVLPLLGGVLVAEALSVMLQVASYRLFKIRIFKVSPLHHHFERAKGVDYRFLLPNRELEEPQITVRFWLASGIFALLGLWAWLA